MIAGSAPKDVTSAGEKPWDEGCEFRRLLHFRQMTAIRDYGEARRRQRCLVQLAAFDWRDRVLAAPYEQCRARCAEGAGQTGSQRSEPNLTGTGVVLDPVGSHLQRKFSADRRLWVGLFEGTAAFLDLAFSNAKRGDAHERHAQ